MTMPVAKRDSHIVDEWLIKNHTCSGILGLVQRRDLGLRNSWTRAEALDKLKAAAKKANHKDPTNIGVGVLRDMIEGGLISGTLFKLLYDNVDPNALPTIPGPAAVGWIRNKGVRVNRYRHFWERLTTNAPFIVDPDSDRVHYDVVTTLIVKWIPRVSAKSQAARGQLRRFACRSCGIEFTAASATDASVDEQDSDQEAAHRIEIKLRGAKLCAASALEYVGC